MTRLSALFFALSLLPAAAQELPVEITSQALTVNQASGTAVFTGDVVIGRGEMRLAAEKVTVTYGENQREIKVLEAEGGVTMVSGETMAEGEHALYIVASEQVEMTGDVLLKQGSSVVAGERLVYDLRQGTGTVTGGVRSVIGAQ